jgi:hypothetical protein
MSYVFRAPAPSHLAWGDQAVDELFNGYSIYLLAECKKEVREFFPGPGKRLPDYWPLAADRNRNQKKLRTRGHAVFLITQLWSATNHQGPQAAAAFSVTTRTLLSIT